MRKGVVEGGAGVGNKHRVKPPPNVWQKAGNVEGGRRDLHQMHAGQPELRLCRRHLLLVLQHSLHAGLSGPFRLTAGALWMASAGC